MPGRLMSISTQERLETGADAEEAARKLENYPDYDVIPIRQGDRLVAFLERASPKPKVIQIQHVLGAETSILDLVDSLCAPRVMTAASDMDRLPAQRKIECECRARPGAHYRLRQPQQGVVLVGDLH